MNIFEQATRNKVRFTTTRGELSVEHLWDMPLTSVKDGFDLDSLARATNKAIKELDEEGFVRTRANPALSKLKLKLEVIKHVILVKLQEEEEKKQEAAKKVEKAKLLEALSKHDENAINNLSREELMRRLANL